MQQQINKQSDEEKQYTFDYWFNKAKEILERGSTLKLNEQNSAEFN